MAYISAKLWSLLHSLHVTIGKIIEFMAWITCMPSAIKGLILSILISLLLRFARSKSLEKHLEIFITNKHKT